MIIVLVRALLVVIPFELHAQVLSLDQECAHCHCLPVVISALAGGRQGSSAGPTPEPGPLRNPNDEKPTVF